MPSMPKVKLIFDCDSHTISSTNWNFGVELSKRTQRNNETKKAKKDAPLPTERIKKNWCLGINKIKRDPIRRIPTRSWIIIIKSIYSFFIFLM